MSKISFNINTEFHYLDNKSQTRHFAINLFNKETFVFIEKEPLCGQDFEELILYKTVNQTTDCKICKSVLNKLLKRTTKTTDK